MEIFLSKRSVALINMNILTSTLSLRCIACCIIIAFSNSLYSQISSIRAEFDDYCRELEAQCRLRWTDFTIETIEDHPDVPALDTAEDSEVVSFIRNLSGINKLSTVSYAAEAGQFSNAGFQTVICGPGDIAQAHRANEFISKDQLEKAVDMLRRMIVMLSS